MGLGIRFYKLTMKSIAFLVLGVFTVTKGKLQQSLPHNNPKGRMDKRGTNLKTFHHPLTMKLFVTRYGAPGVPGFRCQIRWAAPRRRCLAGLCLLHRPGRWSTGLVTNSILFCRLSKIKDCWQKVGFQQSRFASLVLDSVCGPLRLVRHTWWCLCISAVPEATHKASRGPLKGAVSAQKGLLYSDTKTRELLGGTAEHSFSRRGVINLLSREICDF